MNISHQLQSTSPNSRRIIAEQQADEDLLHLIAHGDKGAVEVLYIRHSARVYRFVLRYTKDAAMAEDVVSEVFLDVWRHASSFKGRSQVATWLLAIARHKAIEANRQRTFVVLDDAAEALIEDPADYPEVAIAQRECRELLQNCLKVLSPIHRQIIDLMYYQSKTIYEAAEIVGIPVNTVKTRMFWARNRLSEMLREAGVEHVYA